MGPPKWVHRDKSRYMMGGIEGHIVGFIDKYFWALTPEP